MRSTDGFNSDSNTTQIGAIFRIRTWLWEDI